LETRTNITHEKPRHKRSVNSSISASARARLFLSYLCTRYLLKFDRPKNNQDTKTGTWVHIPERPQKESKRRYIDGDLIPYTGTPGAWQTIIKELEQAGMIKRQAIDGKQNRKRYEYTPGANIDPLEYFDPATINQEREPLNELHEYMVKCMALFSLSYDAKHAFLSYLERVDTKRQKKYVTAFKWGAKYPHLFFKVDDFAERVHTPFSSMESFTRPHIEYNGKQTTSIDLATSQPLILAEILKKNIGQNEFTQWVHEGMDIYQILAHRAQMNTRSDGKKLFFELIFAPPKKELEILFPGANWVQWLNDTKKQGFENRPHHRSERHHKKGYNIIAYMLQYTESVMMHKVWQQMKTDGAPFLSVHDEIIVPALYEHRALEIFKNAIGLPHAIVKVNKASELLPAENLNQVSAELSQYIAPEQIQIIDAMNNATRIQDKATQWAQAERIIYQARAENNK